MSALPPKADMCGATRDVRYGPKADIRERPFFNPGNPRSVDATARFRCPPSLGSKRHTRITELMTSVAPNSVSTLIRSTSIIHPSETAMTGVTKEKLVTVDTDTQ